MLSLGGGGGGEELATFTEAEGTSTTLGFTFLLASACDLSSDNVSFGADGCGGAATEIEETLPRADFAFLLADACAFNSANDNFATDGCSGFRDATDTASEIGERANKLGFFFLPDCADSSANDGFNLDPVTFAPKIDGLGGPTCPASSSSSIPPRGGESCITLEPAKEEPSS